MRSRIDVGDNGSKGSLVVEVPRGTSTVSKPDPEVPARARWRRFSAGTSFAFWKRRMLVVPLVKSVRVTDRPNQATHDRHNGATWNWRFWGFGTGHVVSVFQPPFQGVLFGDCGKGLGERKLSPSRMTR